jgi:hypothetical protein
MMGTLTMSTTKDEGRNYDGGLALPVLLTNNRCKNPHASYFLFIISRMRKTCPRSMRLSKRLVEC